jgi:DNA repair protein SbcC/Rad50
MKILNLRFKNLNSLAGEWFIDFTEPSFVTDGIFAITGPTGSGKTTILDAICLALYGSTPRLDRVTKSSNEIMSRGAGECLSEVTFETPVGKYRCTWAQHRAQKRPTGELQNPKHELAEAGSGNILANSLRTVAEEIEKITGLDFGKFTRSVLLAQGAFAEFLKSTASERAPLLEQLTHTEIYSKLSIRVHERERDEKCLLDGLTSQIGQLDLLPQEQLDSLQAELIALDGEIEKLNRLVAELGGKVDWRKNLEKLTAELRQLDTERRELVREIEEFAPLRSRLKLALTAAELDGPAASLDSVRKTKQGEEERLNALVLECPEIEKACQELEAKGKRALLAREQAEVAFRDFEPKKNEIESLDRKIKEAREAVSSQDRELNELKKELAGGAKAQKEQLGKQTEIDRKIKEVDSYFVTNAADEWLVDGLSGLEVQMGQVASLANDLKAKEKEADVCRSKLQLQERELESLRRKEESARKASEESAESLKRAEDSLRSLLSGQAVSDLRKELNELLRQREHAKLVASFEEHRSRLHSGEPCPLCGALEHPFAVQSGQETSELEVNVSRVESLISKAEKLDAEIRDGITKRSDAERKFSEASGNVQTQDRFIEAEKSLLAGIEASISKSREQVLALETLVLTRLRPLGIERLPAAGVDELRLELSARQRAWKGKGEERAALVNQMNAVREMLVESKVRIEGLEARQKILSESQEQTQQRLQQEIAERGGRFGEIDPVKEAGRLGDQLRAAETAEKTADKNLTAEKSKLEALNRQTAEVREAVKKQVAELTEAEASFQRQLAARAFADEAAFRLARMQLEQRKEYAEREQDLARREVALQERLQDRKAALEQEKSKDLAIEPLSELEERLDLHKAELGSRNQQKGAKQQVIQDNQKRLGQAAELQRQFAQQQLECQRWQMLHELIGSSDGKKFRNFAQAITFERLIAHANQQLSKMSERYELVPDVDDPLELCVRDNDQAGEIRPTKNLSGGESFLISLALALGLSQMASGRVRVDSLFLDEGFGTLDEAALETALSALADLRQTGKLIGLISHVTALNERISTKIEVTKVGEGRSRLTGPGCSEGTKRREMALAGSLPVTGQ